MKPYLAAALALLALAGCSDNKSDSRSEAQRHLPLVSEITLTHSNVSELDGQVAIVVNVERMGGKTVVTIPPITSWPVENAFRGLDKFYYGAPGLEHPVIRVKDEGCDEPVINGRACGWTVNDDGCIAAGFGCFASRKTAGPAAHGATTQPLVFVLQGETDFDRNNHGARFAVHGRFDQDCSGWFSDGTATEVEPIPACQPPAEHTCSISVDPAALELLLGGWGSATVTVTETGQPVVPITLSIVPVPLPPGISIGLVPNPVSPPGTSVLTVQTTPGAGTGTTQLSIVGQGQVGTGAPFQCRTTLELEILPPPPLPVGGCYCAPP